MVNHFSTLFLILFATKLIAVLTLSYLNQFHSQRNGLLIPTSLENQLSIAQLQKALDYQKTKAQVGRIFFGLDMLIIFGWTFGGGLQAIQQIIPNDLTPMLREGLIVLSFTAVGSLINIPHSVINTFWIEEKFGFNRVTPKVYLQDMGKGLILSLVLGLPLLAAVLWVMASHPQQWWWMAFLIFTCFNLFVLWVFPTWIAPLFNQFTPFPDNNLKQQVRELLWQVNFPAADLYIMDASTRSSHSNAYFTGLGKKKRIVFFDTLINQLNTPEILAILAHELGHWSHKHIPKRMLTTTLSTFLGFALLSYISNAPAFYQAFLVPKSTGTTLVLFFLCAPLVLFFFNPISSYFSQRAEFEADHFAKQHASAESLISGLIKLTVDNASLLHPHPWYVAFYYSHPPTLKRIEQLSDVNQATLTSKEENT